jgi:transcriptional antiterminator
MKFLKLLPVKSRKEVAEEYQISTRTLRRWIKKANLVIPKRYLTPKEQSKIYNTFGEPPSNRNENDR